jgi:light-regulated signal transduction histidine kinase (bacteriophytochrome)
MVDRRCESELENIGKELAAFSYSVSHDLRAPLRTLTGFSEALADEYQDKLGASGLDYVRRIREAAMRMEVMINALTELARVSRVDLRHEPVNISDIAAAIATELKRSDPTRNVEFHIQPGLTAQGDPTLLETALAHLMGNSWKFSSKHPSARIEVGREERDGRSVLYVRDDGAGFDPAYADNMFGPFQRFHSAKDFEGIGIGLATVQRIVNRHQGRVWAVGAVEGGATVYIDLE